MLSQIARLAILLSQYSVMTGSHILGFSHKSADSPLPSFLSSQFPMLDLGIVTPPKILFSEL
jgi:hypothetical protein